MEVFHISDSQVFFILTYIGVPTPGVGLRVIFAKSVRKAEVLLLVVSELNNTFKPFL